ncbi:hypothetical protein [Roseovarius mucosus]|uniref:hypothetical protein n=1 Tax=Roseovarius mucosus TaxID=215743 RepID=UPI003BABAD6A
MLEKSFTHIDHRQLTLDPAFRHRKEADNATHLAALRKTLRNTGSLDAILVWREQDEEGKETGRLVLLDGHFRVTAYRAEIAAKHIEGKGIQALIVKGTRIDAELEALRANTKDSLPLTPTERTDAAWALVRRHRNKISKSQLAKASGVSERSIANMRKKLKEFLEAKEQPTGNWWQDRQWPKKSEFAAPDDAERERLIATLATSITEAIRENRIRDTEIKAEAIQRALGQREMADVVECLGLSLGEFDEFSEEIAENDTQHHFGMGQELH